MYNRINSNKSIKFCRQHKERKRGVAEREQGLTESKCLIDRSKQQTNGMQHAVSEAQRKGLAALQLPRGHRPVGHQQFCRMYLKEHGVLPMGVALKTFRKQLFCRTGKSP